MLAIGIERSGTLLEYTRMNLSFMIMKDRRKYEAGGVKLFTGKGREEVKDLHFLFQ